MPNWPILYYKQNKTVVDIVFLDTDKQILKFSWEFRPPRIVKTVSKQNNTGRLNTTWSEDILLSWVIKMMWYWFLPGSIQKINSKSIITINVNLNYKTLGRKQGEGLVLLEFNIKRIVAVKQTGLLPQVKTSDGQIHKKMKS